MHRTWQRHPSLRVLAALVACWLVASDLPAAEAPRSAATVDFVRDVYPILRRACFECHGPMKQEGELRLDQREAARHGAIVPGRAAESELYRRITLPKGHDEIMPARGEPLNRAEIERIRDWINQGAVWPERIETAKHWAYVKPLRPAPPSVENTAWPRNEIDYFILSRLERESLRPSPEADRATLIRRVSLDLIGLPPSPAEVDAFLNDSAPDAYELLVDRLLASTEFGVRWAQPWLDLARYADSHGFQRDDLRDIWAYRDWVVKALNDDLPFDQFTIEQLAGDLLPNATEAQKIATGFHRCAPTNVEAGSEPEETRVNQIIDRVNTTAAVWLGTTLECTQCHDHKYDPFTQREYYQLFAFFNNTEIEADRSNPKVPGSIRFLGPSMPLADPVRDAERSRLQASIKQWDRRLAKRRQELTNDLEAWAAELTAAASEAAQLHPLEVAEFVSEGGASYRRLDDRSVLLEDDPPDKDTYTVTVHTTLTGIRGFKLEALTDPSLPGNGPGRGDAKRPNFVLNTFRVTASPCKAERGQSAAIPVRLRNAQADFSQKNYDVAGAVDDNPKTAWAIHPRFHQPHWATFETGEPLGCADGMTLTFTLVQELGGGRTIGRLRLSAMTGDPAARAVPADVTAILQTPADQRTDDQTKRLLDYRLEQDAAATHLREQRGKAEQQLKDLQPSTTLVMRELEQRRTTAVFSRGDYRTPGDEVRPGTPAVLHPLPDGPRDRLALARWLVDPENPLVGRVTVNRWWAELFGHGLVGTVEDFGLKGEPPTHPELLDWLATEFVMPEVRGQRSEVSHNRLAATRQRSDAPDQESRMTNAWSMKHILRLIVTSATYRQSSRVTPELLAADDQNRLYARGPRLRMGAEMIRDNALAAAGLISLKQDGPPIRPYQPDGLWAKVGGAKVEYVVSPGEDRYRRGLYVVWKRGAPYPSFVNFDATARLACTVKRSRSNTPLQALTLLNDPVYVEAAKALAKRTVTECDTADVTERLRYAFRLCLSREPKEAELQTLRTLLENQWQANRADSKGVAAFLGEFTISAEITPEEFAAWCAVGTALLNLDETITKR